MFIPKANILFESVIDIHDYLRVDSLTHKSYDEAMMHQMGLQPSQKARGKLESKNVVEESARVHNGMSIYMNKCDICMHQTKDKVMQ